LALRNFLLFRFEPTQRLFERRWTEARGDRIEGINLPAAKAIKAAVGVPVLCTGGFQTAEIIREAIRQGFCDGVTIARPLIANNDLVQQFAAGRGRPANPCTYCNRCLVNAVENPLGCYDVTRFPSHEAMIEQIMTVFTPAPFPG
jgi:2,4-dienoyl-CoA reductase-like NADH-dependent reductase (Old Yellow Enzyme family)